MCVKGNSQCCLISMLNLSVLDFEVWNVLNEFECDMGFGYIVYSIKCT